MWYFVASITFRSSEAYAAYTGEGSALEVLSTEPLLSITPKQRALIGKERTEDSIRAQLHARGLSQVPELEGPVREAKYYVPNMYSDDSVGSSVWAAESVHEICASTRKAGNHVCRSDVCHKGRIGRYGFCRLGYWHWVRQLSEEGAATAVRAHGVPLQGRARRPDAPPLHTVPPFRGAPALEVNHPFHIKMNPGIFLGPRCNHDVGVMLRIPPETWTSAVSGVNVASAKTVAAASSSEALLTSVCDAGVRLPRAEDYPLTGAPSVAAPSVPLRPGPPSNSGVVPDNKVAAQEDSAVQRGLSSEVERERMIAQMLEDLENSEFYCSVYASKVQPHVEGLLQTLAGGVRGLDEDIAKEIAAGRDIDGKEKARRVLHRLLSSTNRRMHKGFPEMLSYLLRKPSWYCSHSFANLHFETVFRKCCLRLRGVDFPGCGKAEAPGSDASETQPLIDEFLAGGRRENPRFVTVEDYIFRAECIEGFPWYFFVAACTPVCNGDPRDASRARLAGRGPCLRWYEWASCLQ